MGISLRAFALIALIETQQTLFERVVTLGRNDLRFQTSVAPHDLQFDLALALNRALEEFSIRRYLGFVDAREFAVLETHERTVCMNLHHGSAAFTRWVQWTAGEGGGSTRIIRSFGASIRSRS